MLLGQVRSRVGLIGVIAIVALLLGGVAVAQVSGGSQFTGCLRNGTISDVALGDQPLRSCQPSATEVTWNSKGQSGATWFSGPDTPTNGLGGDGDLYLHFGSGDVFVKESGTWVTQANLAGSAGPSGPQGETGPPGPPGDAGARALRVDNFRQTQPYTPLPVGTWQEILQIDADQAGVWLLQLDYFYGFFEFGGVLESNTLRCRLVDGDGGEAYSVAFVGSGDVFTPTFFQAEVAPVVIETGAPTTFTFECQTQSEVGVGTFISAADLIAILFDASQYAAS